MIPGNEQRRIIASLDGLDLSPVPFPNGKGCLLARVHAVRNVQSAGGEELSMLDKVFKGE